ncbi:hypothetical protein [Flavobacterium sp. NKUCC04_CG]|uniref:hypothetical protein n=1 Tax=Flavobacterium sp. NKUCC04_CG TaxID=2842121 RepID=UPI001C5AA9E4|nr:hypothetical protein [Flavobacterium sp. NKUCC04_CG]MBW3517555.1 hypothetical protein [Flavobacterium sp. NKUCC04_CG]
MIARPNGAGKSTFVKEIQKQCSIGYYINADDIEQILHTNENKLKCSDYFPSLVSQEDWDSFIIKNTEDLRYKSIDVKQVTIVDNTLLVSGMVNSYFAAVIAEFFRYILLECDKSFSFETVMSHASKVSFLKEAKEKGFKTYLYFISTSDPAINKSRVKIRVLKGGHDVEESKIEKRYYASLELLKDAFLAVDRAYICDSSIENERSIFFEKVGDKVRFHTDQVPEWIMEYLVKRLKLNEGLH